MRAKKAGINTFINLMTYWICMVPNFIVRALFLKNLGNEMLGLNSLYTNIISYLSIIELGIGSAIIFSLYKPYAENNILKVKGYLKYYSKFYRSVGLIIFILGIMMMPFLNIFIKGEINSLDAKLYFLLFLVNTILGYFFSYKLCVLNVDQKEYQISIGLTLSKLIIAILQIIFLIKGANYYVYLGIQIVINGLYLFFINAYINRKYTWAKDLSDGRIEESEKNKLIVNVKALFLHKIGGLVVGSTDNLIIAAFINLRTVGIYNSYFMVIAAFQAAIGSALSGVTASIGEFLVKENADRAYELHQKFFFFNFWVVSFVTIALYNTLEQFVLIWLGDGQTLDKLTINLLLINFYFSLMRVSVEKFKDASGLYSNDKYAPLVESVVNLITSLILVNLMGLPGVFLGTVISNLCVVFWVKPKIAYKYVFKKPLYAYFNVYLKYLFIGCMLLIFTSMLVSNIKQNDSIVAFILNCLINIIVINGIYICIFWRKREFKYFKDLIFNKFLRFR